MPVQTKGVVTEVLLRRERIRTTLGPRQSGLTMVCARQIGEPLGDYFNGESHLARNLQGSSTVHT